MHARLLGWSLRARRARNLLNGVILAVTVAVVMLFVSAYAELARVAGAPKETALTRGLVFPKLMQGSVPMAFYDKLAHTDGVVQAFPFIPFVGYDEKSNLSWQMMGEMDDAPALMQDIFPTDPAVIEAWKRDKPTGAIVSTALAAKLNLQVGSEVEMTTLFGPLRIKVVGLHDKSAIAMLVRVHYDYVKTLGGNAGYCIFRFYSKPEDFNRAATAVEEETKNSANPVFVVSSEAWFARYVEQAAAVPAVLGFLGLFLMLTTILTLTNTAAISTRERRTEIATMRVLGYRGRTIVSMLTREAVLLGAISGASAIAITWFVFRNGVQLTPGGNELRPITIGTSAMIVGAITSLAIPLLGTLPSAVASSRAPLVNALRDNA